MKSVPRESWWYGLGLVLLFSLAAAATITVIRSVDTLIENQDYENARRISMVGTWFLTMGFMFLSAGLGMWAIRYAAYKAGLRRLGSFISAMDYLHDGLVALNSRGLVVSANPAAKLLAPGLANSQIALREAFPCLSDADLKLLLECDGPHEIEREIIGDTSLRTLRFRSQAMPDLPLILISDVTERKAQEARQRETARLKLVRRIAGGVAEDLNRILSIISGQTGLLHRLCENRDAADQAANEIYRAIQSGSSLSTHLLDLSRKEEEQDITTNCLEQPLRRAVELLRLALPPDWSVVGKFGKNLPSVNLAFSQIEQTIMNLGLICCASLQRPGIVRISARLPDSAPRGGFERRFAAIVLVSATHSEEETLLDEMNGMGCEFHDIQDEAGAVLTVIRSGIEEAGGRLDCWQADNECKVFRIALPRSRDERIPETSAPVSPVLRQRLSGKVLLLAATAGRGDELEKQAREIKLRVVRVMDTVKLLAKIEGPSFDAVLLDRRLIEPEAAALLRALAKLRPGLPLLVLGQAPSRLEREFCANMRFFPSNVPLRTLFEALAEL